jgi:hypothetical protein
MKVDVSKLSFGSLNKAFTEMDEGNLAFSRKGERVFVEVC